MRTIKNVLFFVYIIAQHICRKIDDKPSLKHLSKQTLRSNYFHMFKDNFGFRKFIYLNDSANQY